MGQAELAARLGVSRGQYAMWETGVSLPTKPWLEALLRQLLEQRLYPAWVIRVIEKAG